MRNLRPTLCRIGSFNLSATSAIVGAVTERGAELQHCILRRVSEAVVNTSGYKASSGDDSVRLLIGVGRDHGRLGVEVRQKRGLDSLWSGLQ